MPGNQWFLLDIQNGVGGAFDQGRYFLHDLFCCHIQIPNQILLVHIDNAAHKKMQPDPEASLIADLLGNLRKFQGF